MEHRYQRRALPARGHVGHAKLVHDRHTQRRRQRCAITDLNRPPPLRLMHDRLAMQTDQVYRPRIRDQRPGGIGVSLGDGGLQPREGLTRRHSRQHGLPQRRRIGHRAARAERTHGFAIRLDDGGIDPIGGRAAH